MSNLVWKLNRLRAMGAGEVVHRIKAALSQRLQARGIGLARRPPLANLETLGRSWLPNPDVREIAPYLQSAERILAGRHDVFALRDLDLGMPPRWNRDPKTGIEVALKFGKTLNYRDERIVGDIKCLWEPNRHLCLTDLAMAFRLSGDLRYARGVQMLLESWWQQCPYPLGPNWSSALELALRLVSWAKTWQLLGGLESPLFQSEEGQVFLQRWLDSIYQHCHFIAGHFSRHSSANNHLFGELTGLHVAALTWPCWPESARWLRDSAAELEEQALKQNGPDGVNREHAIYYQFAVADEMLLCVLAGRANGHPRSPAFLARLERMLEFVAALMNYGGELPMIGDADDALLAAWGKETSWNPYRSLLVSGALLFERGDFKVKGGAFDDKNGWLFGEAGRRLYTMLATAAPQPSLPHGFSDGGYYVLGRDFGTKDEVQIVADCGPLGYLGIAAHGHADALAFTLSMAGSAVLVDPGTYAYHTQRQWRDYFRGTSAHNTVRIDGQDQSQSGGAFLWLRKAAARCEAWDASPQRQYWCASHDGYQSLPDPLLHRRSIELIGNRLLVADTLECLGEHLAEWHWHFAPECQLELVGTSVHVRGAGYSLRLSMEGVLLAPQLVIGAEQPPLGWIARRFDQRERAPTVIWRETIKGNTQRQTVFEFELGITDSQDRTIHIDKE